MYCSRGVSQNSTNLYKGGGGRKPRFLPYVLFGWSLRKSKWKFANETTPSLPQIVSECGNGLPTDCYSMLDRRDGFPRLLVSSQYGSAGDLTAAKRTAYNAWRKGKRNPVGSSLIIDRTKKPVGLNRKDFDANSMLQKLKKTLTLLRLRKASLKMSKCA